MKYYAITGLEKQISQVVLGTMLFSPAKAEDAFTLLDAFVDSGGNTLDTANAYSNGDSEKTVGKWLKERGNREEIVIIDKGAHPDEGGPRLTPEAIASDLEESLERLQTDYIDIYLLHRDDPDVPVAVIMEALNRHYREGKIRAVGVSNWTIARLEEANAYARENGLTGFTVNSPNLSLAKPKEPMWPGCVSVDEQDMAWHERHQFPLLAWSSQAGGFFTGRFAPEKKDNGNMVRVYYSEENWERYRRAEVLAGKKGADTNQIALAYVLQQPFPASALIGPRTKQELQSSLEALHIELSQEDIRWLDLREKPVSAKK